MIVDFQHHFTPRELFKEDLGDGRAQLHLARAALRPRRARPDAGRRGHRCRLPHERGRDVRRPRALALHQRQDQGGGAPVSGALHRRRPRPSARRRGGAARARALRGGAGIPRRRHRLGGRRRVAGRARVRAVLGGSGAPRPVRVRSSRPHAQPSPALRRLRPARSVGREFGGGIASMLGRVRSYQDKVFSGTAGNARHGALPQKDFGSLETALVELPAPRIVFATDYPQEIRAREAGRDFVTDIRTLGAAGEQILSGNVGLLLR